MSPQHQWPVPYHPPVKRSIAIEGHRTSISLEPVFWDMLKDAAEKAEMPVSALVAQIDAERIQSDTPPGLASAIRVWLVANKRGVSA
ncbi:ribbon-helix-helix domain-containing protein [Erythrobacter sp. SCSIO 43205]|uniref:ribbon-helix-helix domain-containing protein n=1 Tax=Erythrobacter sp. SCSIO 43205 TaxID=2779361 RepID=UPI001CA7DB10|nr:ribbon-helix-helix domain-containing protein [Erythrobacter sp. SCSIO 43205]UAB78581.1 ribbon-helix-helix domain-containing protein [Erythrobacter sp. SCSIO 43205]